MKKLLEIMAQLRDPDSGCPWDVEQDFRSIAPYTIEEAYEVADAIDREDLDDLRDELGDLLLQVVFHSQLASEAGAFGFDDVVAGISDKMVRRHPHVFGAAVFASPDERRRAWDTEKANERRTRQDRDSSVLAGIGHGMPALSRAAKLGRRASSAGFDWPDISGVLDKLIEEAEELAQARRAGDRADMEDEFGDLMFSMVNLARHLQIDAEESLRQANRKFEQRFRRLEQQVAAGSKPLEELTLDELEEIWANIK